MFCLIFCRRCCPPDKWETTTTVVTTAGGAGTSNASAFYGSVKRGAHGGATPSGGAKQAGAKWSGAGPANKTPTSFYRRRSSAAAANEQRLSPYMGAKRPFSMVEDGNERCSSVFQAETSLYEVGII